MPTVVIADDSPTLRRIVSSVLTRDGFEVIQAEDGVEAVQTVLRTMPDAVVLDVQMPRVSGYVAARLLKDDWQTADIPIILLTARAHRLESGQLNQTGIRQVLDKPFSVREVIARAQELTKTTAPAGQK